MQLDIRPISSKLSKKSLKTRWAKTQSVNFKVNSETDHCRRHKITPTGSESVHRANDQQCGRDNENLQPFVGRGSVWQAKKLVCCTGNWAHWRQRKPQYLRIRFRRCPGAQRTQKNLSLVRNHKSLHLSPKFLFLLERATWRATRAECLESYQNTHTFTTRDEKIGPPDGFSKTRQFSGMVATSSGAQGRRMPWIANHRAVQNLDSVFWWYCGDSPAGRVGPVRIAFKTAVSEKSPAGGFNLHQPGGYTAGW